MPSKNSLGKGLGAMFPDLLDDLNDKPRFMICGIEELFPNRFQARKEFGGKEQKELVSSIKKNGIIQPIVVRKSDAGYEIIVGERRWRAAQEAGLKDVPVVIREAEDREMAEISIIENLQREELNPIEEAEAFQTLVNKFSLSQEEISSRVGKDRSTIANSVRLLKLPSAVKDALIKKNISAGHARTLLALSTTEEQTRVLGAILKKGLSVRETERVIKNIMKIPPEKMMPQKDKHIIDLEKELSSKLMTAIKIRQSKKVGTIEIKFSNLEDLNRLVKFIMEAEGK
ncbi:MAG: ParB/RepB/Spo0J family partition protein [Thermodesulfobacteriota bacterium]|nr:ParB/RepB/Spo0J family partition protein [Thermodesulfobacteriota bacterium]